MDELLLVHITEDGLDAIARLTHDALGLGGRVVDEAARDIAVNRLLGDALLSTLRPSVCDLVIATTEELHKTEPVTKWISHERKLAAFVCGDRLLKPCASLNCFLNGALNLFNNEI